MAEKVNWKKSLRTLKVKGTEDKERAADLRADANHIRELDEKFPGPKTTRFHGSYVILGPGDLAADRDYRANNLQQHARQTLSEFQTQYNRLPLTQKLQFNLWSSWQNIWRR